MKTMKIICLSVSKHSNKHPIFLNSVCGFIATHGQINQFLLLRLPTMYPVAKHITRHIINTPIFNKII